MIKKSYEEWISETFRQLPHGIEVIDNHLHFHKIDLNNLVRKYGSPLKLTYLPRIDSQISLARTNFQKAFTNLGFKGAYKYAYCLKSNPLSFVVQKVLENKADLEISSVADAQIVLELFRLGKLGKTTLIICNGYKTTEYLEVIKALISEGHENVMPIIDTESEIDAYNGWDLDINVGIRMHLEENENQTSRFGLTPTAIKRVSQLINPSTSKIKLKMIHFFVFSGIEDTTEFWKKYDALIRQYIELKKQHESLSMINIGGGFPVESSLDFDLQYEKISLRLVEQILFHVNEADIEHPDIVTEFGTYTVAGSYAYIFSILEHKPQNGLDNWYLFNGSIMNTMPDLWAMDLQVPVLPLNRWDQPFLKVKLAGLTCDSVDFYDAKNTLHLPTNDPSDPLHVIFLNTGAYQEMVGGYRGINHCLIPSPRHLLIESQVDSVNGIIISEYLPEQTHKEILDKLGY
ncbi:MAG: arginine decarboxylase [Bacteroidota bacterium]